VFTARYGLDLHIKLKLILQCKVSAAYRLCCTVLSLS